MATLSRNMSLQRQGWARAIGVGAAVLGSVAGWVVLEWVAGVDLRTPAFEGYAAARDLTVGAVAGTAAAAALVAWALLSLFERWARRPRRTWLIVVVAAFFASLMGPLSGTGITAAQRVALVALHVITAAIAVPALHPTAQGRARP